MNLKKKIDRFLCNYPKLYVRIIRLFKRASFVQKLPYLIYVKKGFVVLDVGANTGSVSLLLSNIVGLTGKVHAFEPIPRTFALLQEHMSKYSHSHNYELYNCALGNVEEKVDVLIPDQDFGQASMKRHSSGSWVNQPNIDIVQVDSKVVDKFEGKFGKVDFIKLDIEGAELLALKGAHQLISKYKPILYLEVYREWTNGFGYSPLDLYDYLKLLGYQRILVYSNLNFVDISDNKMFLENVSNSVDLLCRA